ncbi:hypothetical protein KDH_12300 [Dictyobacter sp. S3.2.2.5]|uniref:Uncharacterized protein n=1 Tax=Dictyobacter halimunensis TaxID=3026934 RepID=A0ABQ6FPM5_9CHLR|nr:hypothetical protein KDH_12300 [Dictyobacter sp. S3.2.2.5]
MFIHFSRPLPKPPCSSMSGPQRYEEVLRSYDEGLRWAPGSLPLLQGKRAVFLGTGKLAEAEALNAAIETYKIQIKATASLL